MRTRSIGSLEVTVVGIGCNNFGRQLDAGATRSAVHAALDAGINFFDTADSYGKPPTASESLLGEILGRHREEVIIATKFGRVLDAERHGAKPAYVRSATEASLRRLRTDHIDLMQLHIPDPDTPVNDTLGALGELVKEGKIREIGCSNFTAQELREMAAAAQEPAAPALASTQAEYSLLHQQPEDEVLAECERLGISFLPFRPLFNGLLTGKYRPGAAMPTASRIGGKSKDARDEIMSASNMVAVAALTAYAGERGHTVLDLAFGWLLGHGAVASVIAGVSSPAQVAANAAAAEWELTPGELAEVGRLARQH
jgi:aryl-alcohol dehydrogenase-like predicted oxidoreductase